MVQEENRCSFAGIFYRSKNARSMADTSARLALRWGLRVSWVSEELVTIPCPTAHAMARAAQGLSWDRSW